MRKLIEKNRLQLKEKFHIKSVDLQNKEYENINLKKERNEKNAEINFLSNEDNDVSINNGRRYSETLRTCYGTSGK